MKRQQGIVLLLLLAFLCFSCGDNKIVPVQEDIGLQEQQIEAARYELKQQRKKWHSKRLKNYQYVFSRDCGECTPTIDATVFVQNGVIDRVLAYRTDLKLLEEFPDGEEIPLDILQRHINSYLPQTLDYRKWTPSQWWLKESIEAADYYRFKQEDGLISIYYDTSHWMYGRFRTIEGLFDVIQDWIMIIEKSGVRFVGAFVRVNYDSELGYPTDALRDLNRSDAFDFISVKNFAILGREDVVLIPTEFALLQNFPNPFTSETWIPFQLVQDAFVTINIYDTKNQLIRTIVLGNQDAGVYITTDKAVYWDGQDSLGEKVSSGVYYYTLQAGKFKATRKMVIMK